MSTLAQELAEIRARRKQQNRNERATRNALDYRDGYAAGWADYVSFRPAQDVDDLIALNERHVAGYNEGYRDAARGHQSRFHGHPVPENFGHALAA